MICTRPDLSYAVNILSRFVHNINVSTGQYLKGVLRYSKGTVDLKYVYRRNPNQNFDLFTGFVDSDWAQDKTHRKSTTGCIFNFSGKSTIGCNTKK